MNLHLELVDKLGAEHPEAIKAMQLAMEYAPQELQDDMHNKAIEMGLIPSSPSGYLSTGEAIYSLNAIAECLDMPIKEAERRIEQMLRDRQELGLDTSGVIRLGYSDVPEKSGAKVVH